MSERASPSAPQRYARRLPPRPALPAPADGPRHVVHLYAVVRVEVPDVVASGPAEAVHRARARVEDSLYDRFETPDGEYAEEISHALVDVAEDADFVRSVWFESAEHPLLSLYRNLVAWHDAGRPPGGLEALVREARGLLACVV